MNNELEDLIMQGKIREIISLYKADFKRIDAEERYKWVAVKYFQDHWDIESPEFAVMLEKAFSKHVNLLDIGVARPLAIMVYFAKREPESVRSLFRILFDESLLLEDRIQDFKSGVELFVSKMRLEDSNWKSTYQDQHAVSVYLTFKYPDKYYIYKYSILKALAPMFEIDMSESRLEAYNKLCNSIREIAVLDEELMVMNQSRLDSFCYQDPANRMLAMDIAFFAYKRQLQIQELQKIEAKPTIVLEFKKWLEAPTRKNGKPYDYKTIKVYLQQLEDESRKLLPEFEGNINLFTYDSVHKFNKVTKDIEVLLYQDKAKVNGAFPKVLKLYEQFLGEREADNNIVSEMTIQEYNLSKSNVIYNREKFLQEVFLTSEDYDSLINQLIRKKNLILQGAPGVGKTFVAKRLAYSLIGERSSERICFVQFHQSYGYEDFVMGYRPNQSGFELRKGSFYSFCEKASKDPDNDWFFIIDEINRGNISKIFGELLMLIEADKRGKEYEIQLQGTDEPFFIPDNVHIIGMMNTADRSIALIDYALRRRFAFYTMEPAFLNESFLEYIENNANDCLAKVVNQVTLLNDEIEEDPLLGSGYKIGHSYFYSDSKIDSKKLKDIILYEIKPLLNEYWIDDTDRVKLWTAKLLEAAH